MAEQDAADGMQRPSPRGSRSPLAGPQASQGDPPDVAVRSCSQIASSSIYTADMPRRTMQEATFLILTSLAAGSQHGYGIISDVAMISEGRVQSARGRCMPPWTDCASTGGSRSTGKRSWRVAFAGTTGSRRTACASWPPRRLGSNPTRRLRSRDSTCRGPTLSDDADDLERRYRRWLKWYPTAFRREHEEEIIGVLMASAQDGQDGPGLMECLDLRATGSACACARRCRSRTGQLAWRFDLMYAAAVVELGVAITVLATLGDVRSTVFAANPGYTKPNGTLKWLANSNHWSWRLGSRPSSGCGSPGRTAADIAGRRSCLRCSSA